MTFFWSTSVRSVKFLMSQNPKIAYILAPVCMRFSSPDSCDEMLSPIIFDPASPKPKASKTPIFWIALSMRTVSLASSSSSFFLYFFFLSAHLLKHLNLERHFWHLLLFWSWSLEFVLLDSLSSPSSSFFTASFYIALVGLLASSLTLSNIRSMGLKTKTLASRVIK